MKRIALILVTLLSILPVSLIRAGTQPFPETVPAIFKVEYEHDMGSMGSVEYKDGRLVYQDREGYKTATQPTLSQWTRFFREINAAKVYKWSDHYHYTFRPADDGGFHWSIDLQVGDIKFHSDGNTAFPLDGDLTEEQRGKSKQRSWELFMEAVGHLAGKDFPPRL